MQTHHVSLESHPTCATIYIAGLLGETAALETEEIVRGLDWALRAVRVDLRAVVYIDPDSFVRVARVIRRWSDARCARVMLEFPERSQPRHASRWAPTGWPFRATEMARIGLEC